MARVLLLALVACKTQASDARALDATLDAPVVDAAPATRHALEATLEGEWERVIEPYKGLRIRFVGDAPATIQSAKVTRPSLTGEGQDPMRRAQLECQRSLWKPGDALITEIRSVDGGWEGTMLVRDWGFTGKCRHRDARAPARITRRSDRELTIAVTRGKTVLQEWRLVR